MIDSCDYFAFPQLNDITHDGAALVMIIMICSTRTRRLLWFIRPERLKRLRIKVLNIQQYYVLNPSFLIIADNYF